MIPAIDIQSVLDDLEIEAYGAHFEFKTSEAHFVIENMTTGCTLYLWSGLGNWADYGGGIKIKSAQHLKDILELIALD